MKTVRHYKGKQFFQIPDAYIAGMFRGDNGENKVTHLYKGDYADPGLPMCSKGWHYSDSYSIFRNNVSNKGICKICLRRALQGLDGVESTPPSRAIAHMVNSERQETMLMIESSKRCAVTQNQ